MERVQHEFDATLAIVLPESQFTYVIQRKK